MTTDRTIWIITGHYGSGKTEFAINFARDLARQGKAVAIVDIDIVNPYFRSRERRDELEAQGIHVVASNVADGIDLPALSPEIYGLLQSGGSDVVFDVGGDDAGALVLARFAQDLRGQDVRMLFVLNANRPKTATVELAEAYLREIEQAARQSACGIVNNTHLCDETTQEDLKKGDRLARALSARTGLPVAYHVVCEGVPSDIPLEGERMELKRYMKKPWE